MKNILTIILTLLIIQFAHAGDGIAVIKGKSGTGRTQIEIHTREIDEAVIYLKYTIDNKSYEFNLEKDKASETYGYVIHDSKNQVFSVIVDNTKIIFKFWMIPNTKKIQKDSNDHWSFSAYVEGTDPREFTEETRNYPISPRIYLDCTLDINR